MQVMQFPVNILANSHYKTALLSFFIKNNNVENMK